MTEPASVASGLLILDKPAGFTSYDCVHRVKRILGQKRVGHCGTLDPLAEGVLLVLVGPATRLQDSFLALEKQYWFRARLGIQTSTGDREGALIAEKPWAHVSSENLNSILQGFVGEIVQTPPRYAALKHQGKPYYYYARRNIEIPRVPRCITVYSLASLAFQPPIWEGRLVCSRGTYVRTMVEDIAERLESCATLDALVRERVGYYRREDGIRWDQLKQMTQEELKGRLIPMAFDSNSVRLNTAGANAREPNAIP